MNCFLFVFGLVICGFEVWMIYSLGETFLNRRFSRKYQDIIVLSGFTLLLFCINQLHNSVLNLMATVVLVAGTMLLLFSGSVMERIYCGSLVSLILLLTEFVGFRVLGGDLSEHRLFTTVIATILIKLSSFMILQVICCRAKNRDIRFTGSQKITWCFFFYPAACFILLLGLRYSRFKLTAGSIGELLLVAGLCLLLFSNMLLFFLYDHIVSMSERMREYELSQTKDSLNQRHFAIVRETNHKYASLLHDVNNYISIIQSIQLQGDLERLQCTAQSLLKEISGISSQNFCCSPIINAILYEKQQAAVKNHIDFDIFVEMNFIPPDIDDNDLISILCNLIDNALEAAQQSDDKSVKVQLYMNAGYHVLKIRNTCPNRQVPQRLQLLTTKSDKSRHGFGIERVKAIAKKYNGISNFSPENGIFTAIVLLPFTPVSS